MRLRESYGAFGGKRYFVDDVEVSEEAFKEASAKIPSRLKGMFGKKGPGGHGTKTWPMNAGYSLGCNPRIVKEMQERANKNGISVEYKPNGDVIIPDQRNYARLLKLERFHNKDEGFHGA